MAKSLMCPLMTLKHNSIMCREEQCTWWIDEKGCSVKVMAEAMNDVADMYDKIADSDSGC